MKQKMDRKQVTLGTAEELNRRDKDYWSKASAAEKFQTITYLRECFYGDEATTGRLQRVYKVIKRNIESVSY